MQNNSIENIRLDINREKAKAAMYVRTSDTKTRTIHCTLADNGTVINLSDAVIVEFCMKKPDGSEVDSGCVVVGNEIQYTLKTSDISVAGESKCQFVVTYSDQSILVSPEFSLFVFNPTIYPNSAESTNDYSIVSQYIAETKGYAESASEALVDINSKHEQINEVYLSTMTAEDTIENLTSNVLSYKDEVETMKNQASEYSLAAAVSEGNAHSYEESASSYATASATSASNALSYANSAESSKDNAKASEDNAKASEDNAKVSEDNAKASEDNAKASETNAKTSEDNADDYYLKCKKIYDDMGGGTLILGETHTTAGYGDWTKSAYEHSQIVSGNPHQVTYSDVGADASGSSAQALADAKSYADSEITYARRLAQEYAADQDALVTQNVKNYADSHDSTTLQSAKDYADTQDATTLQSAKTYADTQDATNLQSAKDYSDTQDATTLKSAKGYASSVGNSAIRTAESYADSLVSGSVDATFGSIKIGENSDPIGTNYTGDVLATSVSGSSGTIASVTVPAGSYILMARTTFSANATGYRGIQIATVSSASGTAPMVKIPAVNGSTTGVTYSIPVSIDEETTYYLQAYQSSGAKLTLTYTLLKAIKIA